MPADTRCQADPDMLAQAFAKLLASALCGAGSPAIIEIASHETILGGQPALAVVIADHGRELTPAEQRQLFDPFFCRHPGSTGWAWRSPAAWSSCMAAGCRPIRPLAAVPKSC